MWNNMFNKIRQLKLKLMSLFLAYCCQIYILCLVDYIGLSNRGTKATNIFTKKQTTTTKHLLHQ